MDTLYYTEHHVRYHPYKSYAETRCESTVRVAALFAIAQIVAAVRDRPRGEEEAVKQQKQDRRSLRTRQLVSDAMMQLMREKRYSAITVQDVLERAGIGRSTFYAHYFDKDDALASVVELMLATFDERLRRSEGAQGIVPSLELFRHAAEQRLFFQAMTRGQVGERLWEMSQTLLSRNIERALEQVREAESAQVVPLPVMAHYLAGAFFNMFKWWLEADMPYTPEQMDSIFQRLAMPGVWAALGGEPLQAR